MAKVETIGNWATLYLGDCAEIVPSLGKFDAVITSPPYNLRNAAKGSFYDGKSKGSTISYLSYSDDMSDDNYKKWQHRLFNNWFEKLNDGGLIAYNHKPRIEDGIFDDRRGLVPFPIRQEIIWDRCCMVNFSGGFFAPQTERVFLVSKPSWKPNRDCVGWGDIWRIPPETNTPHPAPFPVALADRIIRGCTKASGIVLDPFMGSGTTGVAAVRLGRQFVGVEIEPKYFDIACRRIEAATRQEDLFIEKPCQPVQLGLLTPDMRETEKDHG